MTSTLYLACLNKLKEGTATLETVLEDEGTVRVRSGSINTVLTKLDRQQLDALRTAAQRGK